MAESYSRRGLKDRKHFYQMAMGSLTELEFFIDFAYERKFIYKDDYEKILEIHMETARVLSGLLKST